MNVFETMLLVAMLAVGIAGVATTLNALKLFRQNKQSIQK